MASKISDQQASINKLQTDLDALNKQNVQLNSDASNKVKFYNKKFAGTAKTPAGSAKTYLTSNEKQP